MNLRSFIQGMTIWNWLALIAFLFGLVSVLNSFLGLRSRYLDWQGPKSKVKFRKRLRQLSKQVLLIDQYRKEPQVFALKLLDDASTILVLFLATAAFCLCGWLLRSLNPPGTGLFPLSLALILIFVDFFFAVQLSRLISRVKNPRAFALRVFEFLYKGKLKGLLRENSELVENILTSETFNLMQDAEYYILEIRQGP